MGWSRFDQAAQDRAAPDRGRCANAADRHQAQHPASAQQHQSDRPATEPPAHYHDQTQCAAANHPGPAATQSPCAPFVPQPAAADHHHSQNPCAAHASPHATICNHPHASAAAQHLHHPHPWDGDACTAVARHYRHHPHTADGDRDRHDGTAANADRGRSTRADTNRYRCCSRSKCGTTQRPQAPAATNHAGCD